MDGVGERGAPGVPGARGRGDRGVSTLEVVLLAPLMVLFLIVLFGLGQVVSGRGAVDGAARDAARAGSLERDPDAALEVAAAIVQERLERTCAAGSVRVSSPPASRHERGGVYIVEVSCRVRTMEVLGLHAVTVTGRAASPVDYYRRSG